MADAPAERPLRPERAISPDERRLFCFGYGYSASALAQRLMARNEGWRVFGTTRRPEKAVRMSAEGVTPLLIGDNAQGAAEAAAADAFAECAFALVSAGPDAAGDPTLLRHGRALDAAVDRLVWLGYLSTTGVYGDHQGAWVDERTSTRPAGERGDLRVRAEADWLARQARAGLPAHIFRLAGIYGPGRGPFAKVRDGSARRIIKPGQVFSRIHVEDIATVLEASMRRPNPGAIYNVCDDEPAPPEDVIAHAAELLGAPPPPATPFEEAKADMSPMAISFYGESKRVSNQLIKQELGVQLAYPSYREGLPALLRAEGSN
ncbi:MAG: SDR family oxidoreductase [Pseudomonadota bacterium]